MDHQHNLKAHRKVVSVLDEITRKKIIKQMGLTASEVKEFRCGDVVLTVMFWDLLYKCKKCGKQFENHALYCVHFYQCKGF